MKRVIECSHAIAEAVRQCKVGVIAAYPITPQTKIVEKLSEFYANHQIGNAVYMNVESEHSALSACIGAAASGSRAFTATNSQGLLYMAEMLPIASGMRIPMVMAVTNRAISAPINIWCFTKDTRVLMADLTYKPISEIKVGDSVLGKDKKGNLTFTKVKRLFKRKTDNLIALKTEKFDLICTPEHEFYERNGHRHWTKAIDLKGKKLHSFGYGYEINNEFKKGWLAGMSEGDGCFYSQENKNTFHFRLKVRDEEIVDTFVRWANEFNYPVRKVDYLEKEGYYIAILTLTPVAKSFKNFLNESENKDFCRGYLAGMYDAEGTGPFKVKQAVIYNNNLNKVNKISNYLNLLNLKFKTYIDKRSNNYHIKINNVPEFFIKCRPVLERKRKNLLRMTLKSVKTRIDILDVIPVNKETEVYNLETETNNYIVNGFLVHNCDHSDTMMIRDSGWIQLFAESSQEAYDTMIQAYKISEKTSIPVMVCLDGFVLSHVFETVDLIAEKEIEGFLPEYDFERKLNAENPLTLGYIAYPNSCMKFREKQEEAMKNSIQIIKDVNKEFSEKFERSYGNGLIETYKTDDAKNVIIGMGSLCSTARVAIDELREKGKKIGMIKLKSFRPFPSEELMKILEDMKGIAVIDRALSIGSNAPLYSEIKALGLKAEMNNFIVGLGGRDITKEMLKNIMMKIGQRKEVEWVY